MLVMALQSSPRCPVSVVFTEPEVAQVAAPGVEEEAVVVVRVIRPGPVMAEVTALLILRTGLVTLAQTGN
mgnify:CR=1 FL=1